MLCDIEKKEISSKIRVPRNVAEIFLGRGMNIKFGMGTGVDNFF